MLIVDTTMQGRNSPWKNSWFFYLWYEYHIHIYMY